MEDRYVVVFRIGKEEYAIPKADVKAILPYKETVEVPDAPEHIEGIVSADGHVIPAISFSDKFGLVNGRTDNRQVIITQVDDSEMGIIVDSVTEELRLSVAVIAAIPDTRGERGSCIEGIGKAGKRLIVLLNTACLFAQNELATFKEVV